MLHTCACQYAQLREDVVLTVPIAGIARNGIDNKAPMIACRRDMGVLVFVARCCRGTRCSQA